MEGWLQLVDFFYIFSSTHSGRTRNKSKCQTNQELPQHLTSWMATRSFSSILSNSSMHTFAVSQLEMQVEWNMEKDKHVHLAVEVIFITEMTWKLHRTQHLFTLSCRFVKTRLKFILAADYRRHIRPSTELPCQAVVSQDHCATFQGEATTIFDNSRLNRETTTILSSAPQGFP